MMTETTQETAQERTPEGVSQFSVFMPNRMGRLHELIGALGNQGVHLLAVTVLETTDSATIRFVADDPEKARGFLARDRLPFTETEVVTVELEAVTDLYRLMTALLEAELNVNYLYPFLARPKNKPLLALSIEESDMAEKVLRRHNFRVLKQADVSR
jgi:hypothetical protein